MNAILKIGLSLLLAMAFSSASAMDGLSVEDVAVSKNIDFFNVKARIVLDSLQVGPNERAFILPLLKNKTGDLGDLEGLLPSYDESYSLPVIIINGKKASDLKKKNIKRECPELIDHEIFAQVRRSDEEIQSIEYEVSIPVENWMLSKDASLEFPCICRSCGDGDVVGWYSTGEIPFYSIDTDELFVEDILLCISPEPENLVSKMKMTIFTHPLKDYILPQTEEASEDVYDKELLRKFDMAPEKLSLGEMFRVARLYPEDSEEFMYIMKTADRYLPFDSTVAFNLAASAVREEDYDRARKLLAKVDQTPEVFNLLGVIAAGEGNFEEAEKYFLKAGDLPEAKFNLELLK